MNTNNAIEVDQRNPSEFTMTYQDAAEYLEVTYWTFLNNYAQFFAKVRRNGTRKYLHPDDLFEFKKRRQWGTVTPPKSEMANIA